MRKKTNTYRFLTTWLLAAVLANLLVPAVMEATQLFCQDAPFGPTTEMHTSSSCWMDIRSDATQTDLDHDSCLLNQICGQTIKKGFSETPLIQHHNSPVLGIPLTGSTFYTFPKKIGQAAPVLSLENAVQVLEIYLINSTFLN